MFANKYDIIICTCVYRLCYILHSWRRSKEWWSWSWSCGMLARRCSQDSTTSCQHVSNPPTAFSSSSPTQTGEWVQSDAKVIVVSCLETICFDSLSTCIVSEKRLSFTSQQLAIYVPYNICSTWCKLTSGVPLTKNLYSVHSVQILHTYVCCVQRRLEANWITCSKFKYRKYRCSDILVQSAIFYWTGWARDPVYFQPPLCYVCQYTL